MVNYFFYYENNPYRDKVLVKYIKQLTICFPAKCYLILYNTPKYSEKPTVL